MRDAWVVLGWMLAAIYGGGCSLAVSADAEDLGPPPATCSPGDSTACRCPGPRGLFGTRRCGNDGLFGACMCGEEQAGNGG